MYTKRTSKPGAGNKFYMTDEQGGFNDCVQGKPRDKDCWSLANCVGYVAGRFNEISSEILGKDKWYHKTLYCNAENFIERAIKLGLEISDVPVEGGIMVWQKGSTLKSNDGAGHVEIVETVLEKDSKGNPTKIYNSASSYGGAAFFNVTRTNSNGRWGLGSGYTYRGCIKNPNVKPEPKPEPVKPEPTPTPTPVIKEIKAGDIVIVNGRGTATAKGTGAKTRKYVDTKMKVIAINKTGTNRYALNQYAKGTVGNYKDVTGWFSINNIKKV